MSQQKQIDPQLQDIAEKIQASLPEGLAAATHFSVDEKNDRLLLDFAVHLDKTDYPLVLSVVKKYNGDFGNRKEGSKDVGYFFVPKPKPVPTPLSTLSTLSTQSTQSHKVTESNKVTEETKEKAPIDAKPETKVPEKIKQPSPLTQFSVNYCSVCEDLGDKCNSTTESGRMMQGLCHEALMVQAFQNIVVGLSDLCKVLDRPQNTPYPSDHNTSSQPESEKVQRSTRPTEGHREDGVVWVNDVNSRGEAIEKALEKDNIQSSAYFALREQIDAKIRDGKKGLELGGKWHWLYQDKTTIGRKTAKQFPQRGGSR